MEPLSNCNLEIAKMANKHFPKKEVKKSTTTTTTNMNTKKDEKKKTKQFDIPNKVNNMKTT